MIRSATLFLVTTLALAGCGRVGPLQPKKGMGPVPTALGTDKPATSDQLLKPSMQSRPERNVDILYRSERRKQDQFDLPPGANNGLAKPAAAPTPAPAPTAAPAPTPAPDPASPPAPQD